MKVGLTGQGKADSWGVDGRVGAQWVILPFRDQTSQCPSGVRNAVNPPAKYISSLSSSHGEIKGNKEKYSYWEQRSVQQNQCSQACWGNIWMRMRYCMIRAHQLPGRYFSKNIILGPEGAFVHCKAIKALSQQGLLVPPKQEGRNSDTYGLPGLREMGNRLAGKGPLGISWKLRYSLGNCGFLLIFIIWENMLSWKISTSANQKGNPGFLASWPS